MPIVVVAVIVLLSLVAAGILIMVAWQLVYDVRWHYDPGFRVRERAIIERDLAAEQAKREAKYQRELAAEAEWLRDHGN